MIGRDASLFDLVARRIAHVENKRLMNVQTDSRISYGRNAIVRRSLPTAQLGMAITKCGIRPYMPSRTCFPSANLNARRPVHLQSGDFRAELTWQKSSG
jgi:hypothetical protein